MLLGSSISLDDWMIDLGWLSGALLGGVGAIRSSSAHHFLLSKPLTPGLCSCTLLLPQDKLQLSRTVLRGPKNSTTHHECRSRLAPVFGLWGVCEWAPREGRAQPKLRLQRKKKKEETETLQKGT